MEKFDCANKCPIAKECDLQTRINDVNLGLAESRLKLLSDISQTQREAEINGAMSILTGEVNAEQHDQIISDLNKSLSQITGIIPDSKWQGDSYTEATITMQRCRLTRSNISSVTEAIKDNQEICPGPTLPLRIKMGEKMRALLGKYRNYQSGKLEFVGKYEKKHLQGQHERNLEKYGRCGSRVVRKVFTELKTNLN